MIDVVPVPPIGPRNPRGDTPPRASGSVRRTTTIDSHQGPERSLLVDARGRDLRTALDGTAVIVDVVAVRAVLLGPMRTIAEITADPPAPELDALVGESAMVGFRKALAALPDPVAPVGSLLHLLLDDLVGAALVAGYGEVQAGTMVPGGPDPQAHARLEMQRDLCAGWAADGGMMRSAETHGTVPMPPDFPAPTLERDDDPLALHAVEPMPAHGMRRRRRLDLVADGAGRATFDVHFRDSHAAEDNDEGIIHEYSLEGVVGDRRLEALTTEARVLPWLECPGALASAERVVGQPLDQLRALVRRDFRGTSTCTHLNDALRSLADLETLQQQI
jgi:hypothetical protein